MKYKVNKNDLLIFPYYYDREKYENYYKLYLMGISLQNIKDIIQQYSKNKIIIHDVALNTPNEENIGDIAKNQNVNYKYFNNNCHIMIDKNDFDKFVDFNHYEYYLFDVENELTEEDFFKFRNRTVNYSDVSKIQNKLQYSNIWLYTHDDTWLYTESKNIEFINQLLTRFFETLLKKYIKKHQINQDMDINFSNSILDVLQNIKEMTIIKKCYTDDRCISFPIKYSYIEQEMYKNIDINKLDELIYEYENRKLYIKNNLE